MNNYSKFSEVLKAVIDYGGKEILKDKRKTNNYIGDLVPGDTFQKEKKLLNDVYSCNAVNILLDADDFTARREKAVETAKNKLMDSMSLSESGASLILKEICDSLGWNTQQLFRSNIASDSFQATTLEENRNVSLNKEYYNQPIISNKAINANKAEVYAEQNSVTTTKTVKKKSPWGTVLKVAAVIIVIGVIYNLGKNDGGSETVIIDETKSVVLTTFSETHSETTAAVTTTETATTVVSKNYENFDAANSEQVFNENVAEAALIVPNTVAEPTEITDETTSAITTTQEVTTTVDPRAGKYVVTDIAKFECREGSFEYDSFMTYDSFNNIVYYITAEDLHKYDLSEKSDTVVLTLNNLIEKVSGDSSSKNSLINNESNDTSKFQIDGVVFNQYNRKIYVFAHSKGSDILYLYNIEDDNLIKFKTYSKLPTLSFINEDVFFIPNTNFYTEDYWTRFDMISGETEEFNSTRAFYKIVDINDNYYGIMTNGSVRKFSNIYTAKCEELFLIHMLGADEKDNILYYLDYENNIYKIDLDNLTEEIYISVDDIFQNGKQFLGNGECSGLYMTKDGGFITYDKSDSKLKYVSKNQ